MNTNPSRAPYGAPGRLPRADGRHRCVNAEPGTYGHECGKPATWIGTTATGWQGCYCDHCKEHGHEGRRCVSYAPITGGAP